MAANDFIETSWQREREQKVRYRQQEILLPFQPVLRIFVLTFWTVPIAAGMITILHMLTIRTAGDLPTQGVGATLLNRSHDSEMDGRHVRGILLTIRFSVATENVRQFYSHKFARTWLMASVAGSVVLGVK